MWNLFGVIQQHPPMTKEEEAKASDEALILHNLRYAISIAVRFREHADLDDLIGAAVSGLVAAAHSFDRTRDVKFITYAHQRIRNAIFQTLRELRPPTKELAEFYTQARSDHEFLARWARVREALHFLPHEDQEFVFKRFGFNVHALTLAELAFSLGMSVEAARQREGRILRTLQFVLKEEA